MSCTGHNIKLKWLLAQSNVPTKLTIPHIVKKFKLRNKIDAAPPASPEIKLIEKKNSSLALNQWKYTSAIVKSDVYQKV